MAMVFVSRFTVFRTIVSVVIGGATKAHLIHQIGSAAKVGPSSPIQRGSDKIGVTVHFDQLRLDIEDLGV